MYLPNVSSVKLIGIILLLISELCYSQSTVYGEGPVKWELRKPFDMPPQAEKYSYADLVILSDFVEISFYSSTNEKLVRNIRYKINSRKGIEELKHFEMQESFDPGFDKELNKQDRRSRIKTPFIKEYEVKLFAARKFSRQKWSNVTVKERYESLRIIKPNGEFSDESRMVFDLSTLAIGDVVEFYYEAVFNSAYGTNLFYFYGPYPKLKCEYDFVYRMDKSYKEDTRFVVPINFDSVKTYSSKVDYRDYDLITTKMTINNLEANNYPLNSLQAQNLPHVFADFNYYRSMVSYVDKNYFFTRQTKPKSYCWFIPFDTTINTVPKVYEKQTNALRKFNSTLPPSGSEENNLSYFKALTDSFNTFRYISANHLFYNESALYEISSGDHLLKRRLCGNTLWKLYEDLLKENKVFYYLVNIQDKRFGKHDSMQRVHRAYERNLIALPLNQSYVFFNPRSEGIKYHTGELPFYFEDTKAALIPMNFQAATPNKKDKNFKVVNTSKSSFEENIRKEESLIKISRDSLVIRLATKETLSGQFSTLIRPLYLNELIDSTVSASYFKRCTDKPNTQAKKIKATSKSKTYPFLYAFDCNQSIRFYDSNKISLQNWFAFPVSKSTIRERPHMDYYFDFMFSDLYDYSIEFDRATVINNREAFSKNISNSYFDLVSAIKKANANNYNLVIKLQIKQASIPADKIDLLMNLIQELEELNNFVMEVTGDSEKLPRSEMLIKKD